jgi:hypothetical protein
VWMMNPFARRIASSRGRMPSIISFVAPESERSSGRPSLASLGRSQRCRADRFTRTDERAPMNPTRRRRTDIPRRPASGCRPDRSYVRSRRAVKLAVAPVAAARQCANLSFVS